MENINITQISVNLQAQVGAMNEKKKLILKDIVCKQSSFNTYIETPFGSVFIDPQNNENIVVNFDRITYNKVNNITEEFKSDTIIPTINTIIETLMLEDQFFAGIDIQGISKTSDSHSETVNLFNEKFNNALVDLDTNVDGVGFRVIINDKDYQGDFKIEPSIRDKNYYFYQLTINYMKNKSGIDEIIGNIPSAINQLFKLANKMGDHLK